MKNALYYGDNLDVLRESIASESVDLVYLDPPFNSNANYNVLFKAPSGEQSVAQIEAFEDTWHWNQSAERAFDEVLTGPHSDASIMLSAMRSALGEHDMMAYLAMMAVRLIELHRVLKSTGSLYLHCDPTASHYLKIFLDSIFGIERFQNEIIWQKIRSSKAQTKGFGSVHDTIFAYRKSSGSSFNNLFVPLSEERIKQHYNLVDDVSKKRYMLDNFTQAGQGPPRTFGDRTVEPPLGKHWIWTQEKIDEGMREGRLVFTSANMVRVKRYLEKSNGNPVEDIWTDIAPVNSQAQERLGYPTQKPVALLERIIQASSNPGDIVLDPFCGCGTTIHAAQKLGRQWIGIDVTHLAIGLIELRLKDAFPGISYKVYGVPVDAAGARNLAERDKHEFQKWITATIGAQPYKGGKKGMDRGIDGYLHFRDAEKKPQIAIVSVKGGGIKSGDVRDLKGTVEREKAAMGLFLSLNPPTREMEREAASAGLYETGGQKVPRLQILTAAQILDGRRPQLPFGHSEGFKKAAAEKQTGDQGKLF